MLAPQTLRAMVGIAIAGHRKTAVFADKIFFVFDEYLGHSKKSS
jgi:hypothetical protein